MGKKFQKAKISALLFIMVMLLTACGKSTEEKWQEQYDLGMQYLTDGDYEAAIVAFTAAIEIDPKRAEAYISMADAYIAQDDYEKAEAVLNQGLEATDNDQDIADKLIMLLYSNSETESNEENENTRVENNQENDPLHAYGVTEFTLRSAYREFEDFSESEQQLIENMAAAAISGEVDTDNLRELIEKNAGSFNSYSFWGEYKISIWASSSSFASEIILRPESGLGYYLWIDFFDSAGEGYTTSAYYLTFITCPCEDWQWNGSYLEEEYYYHYQIFTDGSGTMDKVESTITTGNVDNNLFNGTFNSETHITETWSVYTELNRDVTTNAYSVYQEGKLVEIDGQAKSSEAVYSVGYAVKPSSEESWIYEVYW